MYSKIMNLKEADELIFRTAFIREFQGYTLV